MGASGRISDPHLFPHLSQKWLPVVEHLVVEPHHPLPREGVRSLRCPRPGTALSHASTCGRRHHQSTAGARQRQRIAPRCPSAWKRLISPCNLVTVHTNSPTVVEKTPPSRPACARPGHDASPCAASPPRTRAGCTAALRPERSAHKPSGQGSRSSRHRVAPAQQLAPTARIEVDLEGRTAADDDRPG